MVPPYAAALETPFDLLHEILVVVENRSPHGVVALHDGVRSRCMRIASGRMQLARRPSARSGGSRSPKFTRGTRRARPRRSVGCWVPATAGLS